MNLKPFTYYNDDDYRGFWSSSGYGKFRAYQTEEQLKKEKANSIKSNFAAVSAKWKKMDDIDLGRRKKFNDIEFDD